MSNTPNAERKTLILTGASRGIGHATVKRFASAGWRVITCSRHPFPENCPWEMGPEDHIQVDLANPVDTARSIGEMRERLKAQGCRLNALVNNAGISPKGEGGSRLGAIETALEDWQHVFQVNFFAPIMLARGLVEELQLAQGAVVNVTSIAGRRLAASRLPTIARLRRQRLAERHRAVLVRHVLGVLERQVEEAAQIHGPGAVVA